MASGQPCRLQGLKWSDGMLGSLMLRMPLQGLSHHGWILCCGALHGTQQGSGAGRTEQGVKKPTIAEQLALMQSGNPPAAPAAGQVAPTSAGIAAPQHVFTPEQLNVLRNQILAFRAVKVSMCRGALRHANDAGSEYRPEAVRACIVVLL